MNGCICAFALTWILNVCVCVCTALQWINTIRRRRIMQIRATRNLLVHATNEHSCAHKLPFAACVLRPRNFNATKTNTRAPTHNNNNNNNGQHVTKKNLITITITIILMIQCNFSLCYIATTAVMGASG